MVQNGVTLSIILSTKNANILFGSCRRGQHGHLDAPVRRSPPGGQQVPLEGTPRQSLHGRLVLHQSPARPVGGGGRRGARAASSPSGHVGIPQTQEVFVTSRGERAPVWRPLQPAYLRTPNGINNSSVRRHHLFKSDLTIGGGGTNTSPPGNMVPSPLVDTKFSDTNHS